MTAFRILDQDPVYFDLKGQLCIGGNLHFYAAGTTNDKDVFGDMALTVNNGPVIAIDTDGRAVDDIWGNGEYRCRLYASDGTLVFDRDNIAIPGGAAAAIPALVANEFLTNDGAVMSWAEILQVPDLTGQANKVLGNDGTSIIWQALATPAALAITVGANSVLFGNTAGKACLIQWGSGTSPSTGFRQTSTTINFPIAFDSIGYVGAVPTIATATAGGQIGVPAIVAKSITQFSIQFDSDDFGQDNASFIADLPFDWIAIGTKDV